MLRAHERVARTAVAVVMVLSGAAVSGCQSEAACAGRSTPEETLAGFLRAAVGNDPNRARAYADVTYVLEDETVSGLSEALTDVAVDTLDLSPERHGELFYFAVEDDAGTPVGTFSVRRSERCHGVLWAEVAERPATPPRAR